MTDIFTFKGRPAGFCHLPAGVWDEFGEGGRRLKNPAACLVLQFMESQPAHSLKGES